MCPCRTARVFWISSVTGANASGGTASLCTPVQSPQVVSEVDEADDSLSPELGGRAADKSPSFYSSGSAESKSGLLWIRWRCLLRKR